MKKNTIIESIRGVRFATGMNQMMAAVSAIMILLGTPSEAAQGRVPELPEMCETVNAPAGHRLRLQAYAYGVQIYVWSGSAWVFKGPEATLFADAGFRGQIGIHYGGPTWEANDGSQVKATLVEKCAPNPGAIPWLLLAATHQQDHGVFSRITYIQRVNTVGGTAPAEAGTLVGDEARVPYTAQYFFYTTAK
jgi:hypothetical protein